MKFILKHGKSDKDIDNLRQEIEVILSHHVEQHLPIIKNAIRFLS